MKTSFAVAAAIARLAAGQSFDFGAILSAPSPSVTGPPLTAVGNGTAVSVNTASVVASLTSTITLATANVTGASASAASTQEPSASDLAKRWGGGGWPAKSSSTSSKPPSYPSKSSSSSSSSKSSSSSSSSKSSSSSFSSSSSTSTITTQQSGTTTSSSSTACPTTPEAGTYCGFINPEDACAPQPDGYGPQVTPDTVAEFEAYPEFHKDAQDAITPAHYDRVFVDLNASTSANSYISFYTLDSYNVSACADYCDTTDLCTAFNIYIERDPSLNPTSNSTDPAYNCPNPSSITNYKCSLWGSSIDASSATNYGDYRDQFQVVIAGSNGYDKTNNTTPPPCSGWQPPKPCQGGAISSGGDFCLGSNFFPGPFNPALCGLYAQTQTSKNKQVAMQQGHSSYTPANMFNAYCVHKNGVPQGTYCSLFDTVLSDAWASFTGAWSGDDFFSVETSFTYALNELDSGRF